MIKKCFLLILSLCFVLSSCKKGPDDPTISLRSRKARLEGRWRLVSGQAGLTILDPSKAPFAQSFVFDGSNATATETQGSGPPTVYIFGYTLSLDIKKSGNFTLSESYGSYKLVASGHWNFLSGVGDSKNKEEVIFVIESVDNDETYGHLFNKQSTEFSYKILGLKNKELSLESCTKEYLHSNGTSVGYSGSYKLVQ